MNSLLLLVVFLTGALAQDYLYAWSSECGNQEGDFHIIGGQEAEPNSYPWVVSVQLPPAGHFCGGSLITSSAVLTAAHCVDGFFPTSLAVALGEHDFGDNDRGIRSDVSRIEVHPDYDWLEYDNDIALVILSEPVEFSNKIYPICAPNPADDYAGETAIVAGWGNMNSGGLPDYPDVLMEVDVPVISNLECEDDYGASEITENMICAGDRTSVDSCQGDSGGPLWAIDNTQPALIGIVSWGIGCAEGYPGVYARTSNYIDWVNQNM